MGGESHKIKDQKVSSNPNNFLCKTQKLGQNTERSSDQTLV